MKIAIIGAGASSLFLCALLNDKHKITVFERNKKVGSKLLASGNGKCNLLNINANKEHYNNTKFIEKLFNNISSKDILNKFHEMGLQTYIDNEGRVYPYSLSSKSVLDLLLMYNKANIILEYTVNKITKKNNKYIINDYNEEFDCLVLASGSDASIIESKQGICYNYLSSINLKVSNINPSLSGFILKENVSLLSGYRTKALVKLYIDNNFIHEEIGEVIFKDNGISGIVIMNMSFYYNKYKGKNAYIILDILYDIELSINHKDFGILHPQALEYMKKEKLNLKDFKSLKFNIYNTYPVSQSQVISGGVNLDLLDDFKLKNENIYLIGEMLDIDAICGGYNLLFAFTSAYAVYKQLKEK